MEGTVDRSAGWCPPPRRSGRVAEAYLVTARGFRVCRGRCLCVGRVLRTSLHRCRLGVRRSAREPVNLRHAENNITACGERSPTRSEARKGFSHAGLSHFGTPPTRAKHCIDNAGFVPTFISHNTYAEHGKDGGGDRCAGGGPLSSLLCKPGGRQKVADGTVFEF